MWITRSDLPRRSSVRPHRVESGGGNRRSPGGEPRCYPTSAILALTPAIESGLIGSDIIVDSKSGVSGAGRSLSMATHYSEVNENVMAYSVNGHRHLPEISQELDASGNEPVNLTFSDSPDSHDQGHFEFLLRSPAPRYRAGPRRAGAHPTALPGIPMLTRPLCELPTRRRKPSKRWATTNAWCTRW